MTKPFDEQRWARDAVSVQDACNLSGVVISFAQMLLAMSEAGMDTEAKNWHPCSILFSSKISSLTSSGYSDCTTFGKAYEWAKRRS